MDFIQTIINTQVKHYNDVLEVYTTRKDEDILLIFICDNFSVLDEIILFCHPERNLYTALISPPEWRKWWYGSVKIESRWKTLTDVVKVY